MLVSEQFKFKFNFMDPRDMRVTKNAYFLLLTNTKQLLLVTFCDAAFGIGANFWTQARTNERMDTDVEVQTVF